MTLQNLLDAITASAKAKGVDPDLLFNHEIKVEGKDNGSFVVDVHPVSQTISITRKWEF